MSAAAATELWHFRISHYNEKVRWALDHKHWPHRRHALVPGLHLFAARWRSGQNQLPFLRIDGRVVCGSARIIDTLEQLRPQPPLYPRDRAQCERALAIQRHFDEIVAPDLRRLFWSCYLDDGAAAVRMAGDGGSAFEQRLLRWAFPLLRPLFRRNMQVFAPAVAAARARLRGHFAELEAMIGSDGYLVGDTFSIADLAAAAVMTAIVRPPGFPYPLTEPWPQALQALRAEVDPWPGCRWVVATYARHRPPSSEIA